MIDIYVKELIMEQDDEANARKNKYRALIRRANLAISESEALLADRLKELAASLSASTPTADQVVLLGALVDALGKLRDGKLAQLWSVKLASAIANSPKLLGELKGMKSTHMIGNAAGRVVKALSPDRRLQAERRREEGEAKRANMPVEEYRKLKGTTPKKRSDSFLDDLPDATV